MKLISDLNDDLPNLYVKNNSDPWACNLVGDQKFLARCSAPNDKASNGGGQRHVHFRLASSDQSMAGNSPTSFNFVRWFSQQPPGSSGISHVWFDGAPKESVASSHDEMAESGSAFSNGWELPTVQSIKIPFLSTHMAGFQCRNKVHQRDSMRYNSLHITVSPYINFIKIFQPLALKLYLIFGLIFKIIEASTHATNHTFRASRFGAVPVRLLTTPRHPTDLTWWMMAMMGMRIMMMVIAMIVMFIVTTK